MTSIITVGGSDGHPRRCDSRCHTATKPDCDCICGGRYHGAGANAQAALTRDVLGDDWQDRKHALEAQGIDFTDYIHTKVKRIYSPQGAGDENLELPIQLN